MSILSHHLMHITNLLKDWRTGEEPVYFLPRRQVGRETESKMAMKLTTEAVKMRFPGVSNISTDELFQMIKADNSRLLLLVSGCGV